MDYGDFLLLPDLGQQPTASTSTSDTSAWTPASTQVSPPPDLNIDQLLASLDQSVPIDLNQKQPSTGPQRKLPACSACRLTKTKCVRADVGQTCLSCQRKGIQCLEAASNKPGGQTRLGRRIKEAKQRFGESPNDAQGTSPSAGALVSQYSVNTELGRQEESESFLASLVDAHYASAEHAVPLIKWHKLRTLFEEAGRRPKQLHPGLEPFIRCIFAFGALVSDSPCLVGSDAPRSYEMEQCRGQDLSLYGQRRRAVAEQLLNQAASSIDALAVWRDPSDEGVAVMTLMSHLLDFFNESPVAGPGRTTPYLRTALASLQADDEDKEATTVAMAFSSLVQTQQINLAAPASICIEDAYMSAWRGTPLRITDQELPRFVGPHMIFHSKRPKPDNVLSLLEPIEDLQWLAVVGMSWSDVLVIGRDIASKIATRLHELQDFPVDIANDIIDRYERHMKWLELAKSQLFSLNGLFAIRRRQRELAQVDLPSQLEAAGFMLQAAVRILLLHAEKHRASQPIANQLTLQRSQMDALVHRLQRVLFLEARRIAQYLATKPITEAISFGKPVRHVASDLRYFCEILLSAKTDEEGGDLAFSRENQRHEAQVLIDCLMARTWVWPAYREVAEDLRHRLDGIQSPSQQQITELTSPGSTPEWLNNTSFVSPEGSFDAAFTQQSDLQVLFDSMVSNPGQLLTESQQPLLF